MTSYDVKTYGIHFTARHMHSIATLEILGNVRKSDALKNFEVT